MSAQNAYSLRIAGRDGGEFGAVMLAPGCCLAEARRAACLTYGAERVLSVEPHMPPAPHHKPTTAPAAATPCGGTPERVSAPDGRTARAEGMGR